MRLVWCQGGNPRSARLAVAAGWWYGFRSDSNHYADELGPVALVDVRWDARVDWPRHLDVVARLRPYLAAVPDVLAPAEFDRALRQAEQLAAHASPLVVPKCYGLTADLPREFRGRPVVLGFSVPTSYGGTPLPVWEFAGWPVHLLGGNARRQVEYCSYMRVVSADGNLAWRLARRGIVVTPRGTAGRTLRDADGVRWPGPDAPLEALRRSLVNLRQFWDRSVAVDWRKRP